ADQLQQWLLSSKRMAARAQSPRGLRVMPVDIRTTSQGPVRANQLNTPHRTFAGISGVTTEGLPWSLTPGMQLVVYDLDNDPTDTERFTTPLPINLEVVTVLGTPVAPPPANGQFFASYTLAHGAGFTIKVLAYARDLQYIEQPDDFVVQPGL